MFRLFLSSILAAGMLPPLAAAQTAPTSAPDSGAAAVEQANQLLAAGDYAQALTLLQSLNAKTPHNPDVLYDMGLAEEAVHSDANAQPEAEADYRAAIAANALMPLPHVALGLLLARSGRQAEAREQLQTALQIPEIPAAAKTQTLRAMARLDLGLGNPKSASGELAEAIQGSQETPEDMLLTGEIAEAIPDLPTAEEAYRRYLTDRANDPNATAALAHVLMEEKKPAEAEALLQPALTTHPGDPVLTARLAATLVASGDPAKVAQAGPLVEKLHTANPSDTNIARLLARIYAETGRLEEADAIYMTLLENAGAAKDPTLLADRGDVLIRLNRPAEAEIVLKQALAERAAFPSPQEFGDAALQLAFAAAGIDDPRTILQALSLRASVLPSSLASLFLEATARDELHQSTQAAELYKTFLAQAHGTFPEEESRARARLSVLQGRK